MPLLDSDVADMNNTTAESEGRPRSGSSSSTSGGIRNIFRKKHKSGDESRSSSRGSSPGTTPSKVKNFFDVIRPRSKSDGNPPVMPGKARRSSATEPPTITEGLEYTPQRNRSSSITPDQLRAPGSYTPMSQLLADKASTSQDQFRHRAYSEPRNATSTVLRARQAALAKKVTSLSGLPLPHLTLINNTGRNKWDLIQSLGWSTHIPHHYKVIPWGP